MFVALSLFLWLCLHVRSCVCRSVNQFASSSVCQVASKKGGDSERVYLPHRISPRVPVFAMQASAWPLTEHADDFLLRELRKRITNTGPERGNLESDTRSAALNLGAPESDHAAIPRDTFRGSNGRLAKVPPCFPDIICLRRRGRLVHGPRSCHRRVAGLPRGASVRMRTDCDGDASVGYPGGRLMWPIAECGGPSWICVPTASEIKGIFTVAKSVSLWAGGWLSSRVKWTDHHFIFQYIFRIDISFLVLLSVWQCY